MRFVIAGGGWQLVDDDGRLIASIKSEAEVLALRCFCERFLAAPNQVPEHFEVEHAGKRYTVTPLGSPGEKLSIHVSGEDGSSTIRTEFVVSSD